MLAMATGIDRERAWAHVSAVVSSDDEETAAAMFESMRDLAARERLSLGYDGGTDITVSAAMAELDPPPAPSGRAGFEAAIRKAGKRRRGGKRRA